MIDTNQQLTSSDLSGGDALKEFQLAQLPISEKSKPEFGKKIANEIWGYVIAGLGGYFYNRNVQFTKNRNWANGRIDIQAQFQDRFQFNGKQNYIRLVWNTLQIVNRIVSGLVGRWMQRNEKVVVKAIDDLSQNDKQEEYEQIKFIIENREKLQQLQEASGVQMIPNQELPRDTEELNLWQQQFQKIPEEIVQELGCNEVLSSNGWFDVLKEKMLHDSAEVGFVGTYTWMDDEGIIHIDWVKPENAIYSASEYEDFRETSWRGEIPDLKISELRKGWGKEFHPENPLALTEEQLFKIATTAKEYKTITNLTWNPIWNNMFLRPYDEWNIRCMKFELRTVDSEPYTVTTTKATATTYTQKGFPVNSNGNPKKPSDNQKIIDDSNINIYKGVFLPDNNILLEWKLKDNMIRPQDPKEAGNAEFSYSFYMYQNWLMRNLAIPEKIEAAVDGMILSLLKIQQIVARLIPTGWAIDETKLNEIDYGLGDDNKNVDHARQFFQTGLFYYKGVDAEGIRDPNPPIKEMANSGFIGQMQGLIQNYQFWYQTLKDELGEDPNLISAALQPRVTSGNVDAAQSTAENATDYMYRAYSECMKMTARKVSCLLKDSIMYGGQAYRDLVGDKDMDKRIFSTDIKLLPTEQEIAQYDAMLQNAINSTPELAMFLNQLQAMEMAKEDVKLAWVYYNQCMKKMMLYQQQQTAQNAQLNAQAQQQSLQMKAQFDMQQLQTEMQMKGDLSDRESKNRILESMVNGIMQVMAKGIDVQPEWKPVETEIINNTLIPLFAQNMQNTGALGAAIKQQQQIAAEQMAEQQQAAEQQSQQQNQSQPQPQAAA